MLHLACLLRHDALVVMMIIMRPKTHVGLPRGIHNGGCSGTHCRCNATKGYQIVWQPHTQIIVRDTRQFMQYMRPHLSSPGPSHGQSSCHQAGAVHENANGPNFHQGLGHHMACRGGRPCLIKNGICTWIHESTKENTEQTSRDKSPTVEGKSVVVVVVVVVSRCCWRLF